MKINNIQSYNTQSNNMQSGNCRKIQNPSFGIMNIDGRLGMDLTDLSLKLPPNFRRAVFEHFDVIKKAGLNSSKLVYEKLTNGKVSLFLENFDISTIYAQPLANVETNELISAWLKIKPDDIVAKEQDLIQSVIERKDALFKKAFENNRLAQKILSLSPTKETNISKAIDSLPEEVRTGLLFKDPEVRNLKNELIKVDIEGL